MQETLTRDDIVGKKIQRLWQTPWKTIHGDNPDDYAVDVCSTFVELDDNTIFMIQWQDCFEELPINRCVTLEKNWIEPDWEELKTNSYGMIIVEVLTSKYIPTFCLLLNNNYILYDSDYGPFQTGPLISELGEMYTIEDFSTYWGHNSFGVDITAW